MFGELDEIGKGNPVVLGSTKLNTKTCLAKSCLSGAGSKKYSGSPKETSPT
jgi:hypothetical protein